MEDGLGALLSGGGEFLLDYVDESDGLELLSASAGEGDDALSQASTQRPGAAVALGGGAAAAAAAAAAAREAAARGTEALGKDPEMDAKAWLKRRRAQIAKASRKARAKRRLRRDELHEENERLRKERASFLNKIEDLQLKVTEMRGAGQVDVRMENELLRAQLEEHKRFLSSCFKLHHGIPSSRKTLQSLHEQGSSFAEAFTHSLLSRSATEDWTPTKIPAGVCQTLRPDYNLKVCHKVIESPSRCLHLRLDIALRDVPIETIAHVYWGMWTDEESIRKTYGITYPFQLTRLDLPAPQQATEDKFDALCYVEHRPPPELDCEWVFLLSKRRQQVVKSTLAMPRDRTPALARGEGVLQAPDGETKRKRRRGKAGAKKEAAVGTFGKTPGWLLTRSTTQHMPVAHKEGVQRIQGLLVEGMIAWEQGMINEDEELEVSFVENRSSDILVEKEMCSRFSVVVSIPHHIGFGILKGYSDVIDGEGTITPQWCQVFDQFAADCVAFEAERQRTHNADPLNEAHQRAQRPATGDSSGCGSASSSSTPAGPTAPP